MAMTNAFQRIRANEARSANLDKSLVVKDAELQTFTESLRDLYEAGVPINEMLRQLQRALGNKQFALALGVMADDIENGKVLSEAMGRYPNAFADDYRALIRAAEQSGKWTKRRDKNGVVREGILEMLIGYIQRRNLTRERVKSGFVYPAVIAFAILAALLAFGFYILPALRSIFEAIGPNSTQNVGSLTRLMFWLGDIINVYWWALPLVVVGGGFFLWSYWQSGGKKMWMYYQLRIKVIGPLFTKLNLAETLSLMGVLFSAGMTPQEVLDILIQSTRNEEIAKALELAKEYLYQGISFCDSLKKSHWIFDSEAYMVLSTAQKSGRLGVALQNYADKLFQKVDQEIDRVVKLIEPVMIIIAGLVVGAIAISYYSGLSSAVGSLAAGSK